MRISDWSSDVCSSDLKVDVWRPAGAGPFKTVLMVHGGCWQTAVADRSLMDWIAADLRDAGYAVWNIDYRGVDRDGGGYPGTFLYAARAADALRAPAGRFGMHSSGERRVGTECVRTCSPRWSPYH